jgi:hypothetical protein
MSLHTPYEEPGESDMAHRASGDDPATREAAQRSRTIRLAIIGLVAGTSLGYVAVSLRNGDMSWLKNLGISSAKAP